MPSYIGLAVYIMIANVCLQQMLESGTSRAKVLKLCAETVCQHHWHGRFTAFVRPH